jgi:hypothetical protein
MSTGAAMTLRIEFGKVPLIMSAGMIDGAQVRIEGSAPVAVMWPRGLCITKEQRQGFVDRVTRMGQQAKTLSEFLALMENDAALEHETDMELFWSLI